MNEASQPCSQGDQYLLKQNLKDSKSQKQNQNQNLKGLGFGLGTKPKTNPTPLTPESRGSTVSSKEAPGRKPNLDPRVTDPPELCELCMEGNPIHHKNCPTRRSRGAGRRT